jgi:2,3-bisphosphoglycerate-dependent phosphoglycerate mutase
MAQLILVRHGQSLWNALNKFTGWVDVPMIEIDKIEQFIDRCESTSQCSGQI